LQYFGLALVIGLTSGAYSSIFIASPVLATLKEREPRYINIRNKLANRAEGSGLLTPRQAAALAQASSPAGGRGGGSGAGRGAATPRRQTGVLRPGVATQRAQAAGDDDDDDFDEDVTEPVTARARSRSNGAAGGARTTASSPRRPPPRPRKGKGSKKGGRRR
jgi:hypothetical protein